MKKMNFKVISTFCVTIVFTIALVTAFVLHVVRYEKSSVMDDIYIRKISGDETVMDDININGEIVAWAYRNFDDIDTRITDFSIDVKGYLNVENNKILETSRKNPIFNKETDLWSQNNVIIPKDADVELLEKVNEVDNGYEGYFTADKFTPYFRFLMSEYDYDTFLVIKPDYYVECDDEMDFRFYSVYFEEQDQYEAVSMLENNCNYSGVTSELTVKIGDDYYMVLPTADNAVGTNGIYKFQMSDDNKFLFFGDYAEGTHTSYEENVLESVKNGYEKLIDIPINFENQNNKVVVKMFEHNGDLYLISSQKQEDDCEELSLEIYDIDTNKFIDGCSLGVIDSDLLNFYVNDEYLTIETYQNYNVFETYDIETFKEEHYCTIGENITTKSVFYNGENLYLFNAIDCKPRDYDESTITFNQNNQILVCKGQEQLFKAELHTNIYQDYKIGPLTSVDVRRLMSISFESKVS